MAEDETRARFAAARVARLGTADAAGRPHLVPVTFAVLGDTVVIAVDHKPKRHTDLKRLRNIRANPAVTLLADHYTEDWDHLWWARADGTARVLDGGAERVLDGGTGRAGGGGTGRARDGGTERAGGGGTERACEGAGPAPGASGGAPGVDHRTYVGLLVAKYPQYAARPPTGPVIEIGVTRWRGWSATA